MQAEIEERLAERRARGRGAARRGRLQTALLRVFIDHPDGVTLGAVRARHRPCSPTCASATHRGLLAGQRAPADQAQPLPSLRRPPRARAHLAPASAAERARRTAARARAASPVSWWARPTARSLWPPRAGSSRSPTRRSVVRTSSRSRRENLCHARSWKRCTPWRARRASSPRS